LIEVLITVVILATLSAMVIPRFTGQVRKAEVAEAIQMLGTISRATKQYRMIQGGGITVCPYYVTPWVCTDVSGWKKLGFQDLNNVSKLWRYSTTANHTHGTVKGDWVFADRKPQGIVPRPFLGFSGKFWACGNCCGAGTSPIPIPALSENPQACMDYIAAAYPNLPNS